MSRVYEWIPVTERLPEIGLGEKISVIVTAIADKKPFSISMSFVNRMNRGRKECRFEWCGAEPPFEVIAWMPLPEPYVKTDRNTEETGSVI